MTTGVPGGPLSGATVRITGRTRNFSLLVRVPLGVVTVTKPPAAPLGTVAVRNVLAHTLKVAGVPLKETAVVLLKPCPRIRIGVPTLPEVFTRRTNGARPRSKR